ncbi:MAG: N-formylglutamate amidohydrolase [Geminicoccaceae bacterium]
MAAAVPSAMVEEYRRTGRAPVLLLCDHAGKLVPAAVGDLGIDAAALSRHIGWDIGAADLTRRLADLLDAPAILNHVSRLVIDANRRPLTPTSIPAISDGCVVPANEALDPAAAKARVREYFLPYHRLVARRIGGFRRRGVVPAVVAVHSFTPRMNGQDRPWQVGVVWRGDRRLSAPVLSALEARGDLTIGDNQPYSGLSDFGFTVQFHAQRPGLAHIMFEVRQDEIAVTEDAHRYARILYDALRPPLGDPALYSLYDGDNLGATLGPAGWRHRTRTFPAR